MDTVKVELTGVAQVRWQKTVELPTDIAKAILADDGAIKTLLMKDQPFRVNDWSNVFGLRDMQALAEPILPAARFSCANHYCGWEGSEDEKAERVDLVDATLTEKVCPLCQFKAFHPLRSKRHG